jgi:hypothetical protein
MLFFWYRNILLSLFKLFNLGKCPITGHKLMATLRKMVVYFKEFPEAVTEFKNGAIGMFFFVLHSRR